MLFLTYWLSWYGKLINNKNFSSFGLIKRTGNAFSNSGRPNSLKNHTNDNPYMAWALKFQIVQPQDLAPFCVGVSIVWLHLL